MRMNVEQWARLRKQSFASEIGQARGELDNGIENIGRTFLLKLFTSISLSFNIPLFINHHNTHPDKDHVFRCITTNPLDPWWKWFQLFSFKNACCGRKQEYAIMSTGIQGKEVEKLGIWLTGKQYAQSYVAVSKTTKMYTVFLCHVRFGELLNSLWSCPSTCLSGTERFHLIWNLHYVDIGNT